LHLLFKKNVKLIWIPAYAGMTKIKSYNLFIVYWKNVFVGVNYNCLQENESGIISLNCLFFDSVLKRKFFSFSVIIKL